MIPKIPSWFGTDWWHSLAPSRSTLWDLWKAKLQEKDGEGGNNSAQYI